MADFNQEPGESEYSWGKGLEAPESRGYVPEPWEVAAAIRRTDPAEADAVADPTADPATVANTTATKHVREV